MCWLNQAVSCFKRPKCFLNYWVQSCFVVTNRQKSITAVFPSVYFPLLDKFQSKCFIIHQRWICVSLWVYFYQCEKESKLQFMCLSPIKVTRITFKRRKIVSILVWEVILLQQISMPNVNVWWAVTAARTWLFLGILGGFFFASDTVSQHHNFE